MDRINYTIDEEYYLKKLYSEFKILFNIQKIKKNIEVFIVGENRTWKIKTN
jgi:hypothetical protein